MNNKKGFTLVEVIVVLVILAILAAIMIPAMVQYINRAEKNRIIPECKMVVISAQALYTESYATGEVVTVDAIKQYSGVDGDVSDAQAVNGELQHITYTKAPWKVVYCRNYGSCSEHDEMYNINNVGSSGTGELEGTKDYFYIANDSNYKVITLGDLNTYDFGPYGQLVPEGSVFYWQGKYYYTRNNQYLTNSNDRQQYIDDFGMKIDNSEFKTPGQSTQVGDLKIEGGNVFVFFPYNRYSNDYQDASYWFPVSIERS